MYKSQSQGTICGIWLLVTVSKKEKTVQFVERAIFSLIWLLEMLWERMKLFQIYFFIGFGFLIELIFNKNNFLKWTKFRYFLALLDNLLLNFRFMIDMAKIRGEGTIFGSTHLGIFTLSCKLYGGLSQMGRCMTGVSESMKIECFLHESKLFKFVPNKIL